MAMACEAAEGAMSQYSIAPDLAVATKPLPGEPLLLVTFSGKPAETFIVQVIRANDTAYAVHLRSGKWGSDGPSALLTASEAEAGLTSLCSSRTTAECWRDMNCS